MAREDTQISAHIADSTKALLEEFVEAHGVKKARLIEDALLHHVQALRELPPDIIIPPQLSLTKQGAEEVLERIRNPRKPTRAMRELMST